MSPEKERRKAHLNILLIVLVKMKLKNTFLNPQGTDQEVQRGNRSQAKKMIKYENMKTVSVYLYVLTLTNCIFLRCHSKIMIEKVPKSMSIYYEEDRKKVADCFVANVEYYRRFHRFDWKIYVDIPDSVRYKYESYYSKYPGAEWDPANFFIPFASRYNEIQEAYVNSPIPTVEQITVTTDTIVYSDDHLFCVAFLVIELHYDEIEGLEPKRQTGRKFSAQAIIGYRDNVEKTLDIYPLTKHKVVGFESFEAATKMLKDLYFNKLRGKGITGSVYEGKKFNHNVGDRSFFKSSPYFQKHKSGLYNFQMYRHLAKDKPYNYLTCD